MSGDTGVLLVNLGTPDAPDTESVRRYLAEFLADPRVLDMSSLGRWALLNLVILRRRPPESAAAYRKIWTDDGSPLLVHGRALTEAVAVALPEYKVELAMRYGAPSIADGLASLRKAGCDRVIVFPLYPHYAASSTGSTVEAVYRIAAARWNTPYLSIVPAFYDDPRYIEALAKVGEPTLAELDADHVLMSFHGLPEHHMRKSDESGDHCLARADCCDTMGFANRNCYRAQCYATARALAQRLDLDTERHSVSFQSRLTRVPWIRPYTDEVLPALAKKGVKRVAVYCPAFVADCLETLEEIGIRAKQDFETKEGLELRLVPGLNTHPAWVEAVVGLIRDAGC